MAESFLSFPSSSEFRDKLLVRNLAPYNVEGVYVPNTSGINVAVTQSNFSVIDSPDELISENPFADQLWVKNKYGPDGGFDEQPVPIITYPVKPGSGEYEPKDTVLDLVNEFYIDAAYIENIYGPEGGYKDMYVIDSIQNNNKLYVPYWDPPNFLPSFYTPYEILTSTNPTGTNGPLSQDSFIARLGAETLRNLFQERIAAEIFQNTIGQVNLDTLQDPFEASLLVTGQQPLVYRNWKITVPENPILRVVDLATRLAGAYWPVSPIPGDYFDENQIGGGASNQTSTALNVINQTTGGFLGPVLNLTRNPSQIFLANTGNGQRSALFNNISYNRFQPNYDRGLGGLAGIATAPVNLITALLANDTLTGGFYVGNKDADPSLITSPPNQIPVNAFGQQDPAPVYGPSEMGILYEGNIEKINFGLAGKTFSDGGGIDGQFVWVSPKYKGNLGYHATVGGGAGTLDEDYNLVSANITRDSSTNIEFKKTSILDQTQRLIDSADNVTGIARLKHVGNAINQVSKVFNDGYREITKGSQVLSYKDNTTGTEKGREYCRVFTKDTPYLTYNDLQKKDGITTSGRRFTNSVLDSTFNLNISPTRNPGSTNIVADDAKSGKGGYAKKYMFSIENLAWRTSSRPGFTYDELPTCEKGPNGGRVMWFPPYDLKFNDTSSANWNETTFLGRPENIYTYKSTSRSGTLSWKILVDSPSVLNIVVEKQLKGQGKERINSILESFFAGCVKYDIYELAKKFNQIPPSDLYTYQEILNNPRLTNEELSSVTKEIPKEVTYTYQEEVPQPVQDNVQAPIENNESADLKSNFVELAFYFHNNVPGPNDGTTANIDYKTSYDNYLALRSEYTNKANEAFNEGDFNRNVDTFFDDFVIGNFNKFTDFITNAKKILDQEGASITLTLQGSASAKSSVEYNKKLSKRRIDSIKKYFETTELKPFITDKKTLVFKDDPEGEIIVIPKSDNGSGQEVDCNVNVKDKNGNVNNTSEIYSLSAMACRRVKILDIVVTEPPKKEPEPEPKKTIEPVFETKTGTSATTETVSVPVPKPEPTVEIVKKLKDGIGKKILRQLLTECDYFEVIKEDTPFVYETIKEKIRYFNPTFHSMTPEGLNARLTFLNQCVRPGETIPVIGPDGQPRYNDAVNTSFGAPPILVLRIGDFYHSKIVPKSVSFQYEPLLDINPEGIGIQPMIANVSLNFDFIGGQGLARPIEQLQNALSFNYYANTEIYDERAVWTEDTSALDKTFVNEVVNGQSSAKPNTNNQQTNDGGSTIGEIITNIPVASGQTGEISYQKIMDGLLTNTQNYMTNIVNQLEKINLNYNYGIAQLVTQDRDEKQWKINWEGADVMVPVFGTPSKVNTKVKTLFESAKSDVDGFSNPLINGLLEFYTQDSAIIRTIQTNLKKYLDDTNSSFSIGYTTIIQEILAFEKNYFLILNKINLLNLGTNIQVGLGSGTDGKLISGNVPRVYNISGTSQVSELNTVTVSNTYEELIKDYQKLEITLVKYRNFIYREKIIADGVPGDGASSGPVDYNDGNFTPAEGDFYLAILGETKYDKTFFMIMSRILDNNNNKNDFLNKVIKGVENEPKVENRTKKIINDIADRYSDNLKNQEKLYSKIPKKEEYKELVDGIEDVMYKKGKTRKFNYSTVANPSTNAQQETAIKDLYLKPIKLSMNE